MRISHLVLVLAFAVVACSTRAPFSPWLVPAAGASGTFDPLIELRGMRETALAPGASPAKPRIDGNKGVCVGDFLATYSFGNEEPLKETEDPRQDAADDAVAPDRLPEPDAAAPPADAAPAAPRLRPWGRRPGEPARDSARSGSRRGKSP
jgi:hypothetical protein